MSLNADIKMYQTLSEESSWLNFKYNECRADFRISEDAEWQELALKPDGNTVQNTYLVEGGENFDLDSTEINVSQTFSIDGLDQLFAAGDNSLMAVALPRDVIGVMAVWWSDKSCIRGCEYVGEITCDEARESPKKTFSFRHVFGKGVLAGDLSVEYKLYLKDAVSRRQAGFAAIQGTILGSVGMPLEIIFEGDGQSFPISTISKAGAPLWWTEINISDPYEDDFSEEYFNIIINDKHPAFKYLGNKEGYIASPVFATVIADALEEFFIYLKYEENFDFNAVAIKDIPAGTVAYTACWMASAFELDTTSVTGIHKTVHKMTSDLLRGGATA